MKPKSFIKKHRLSLFAGSALLVALVLWAAVYMQYKVTMVNAQGIFVQFPNGTIDIPATQVSFPNSAFVWARLKLENKPTYDPAALQSIVATQSQTLQATVHNPGVTIVDGVASLDAVSTPGLALDQGMAVSRVGAAIDHLQNRVTLSMQAEQPSVSVAAAEQAVSVAQAVLASPVTLNVNGAKFSLSPTQIGAAIVQTPQDGKDFISFDAQKLATSLQQVVAPVSQPEQDLDFSLDAGGNVTDFVSPKDGISIDANVAAAQVSALLQKRIDGTAPALAAQTIALQLQTIHGGVSAHAKSLGIQSLLGTATTPFAGSTKNRIHNITVGATKLNGSLVQPGAEFSTIGTLGEIGPDTGYVEELVILGPNTVPAYGGGLCQVSTTLFRAILNAGLPVTERQNHSYRVSFYEKDGDGKSIGPGLDATIYDPSPDLKFRNDTSHAVLVTDQIVGTKITFSLYGTPDGRTSQVIGPTITQILPAPAAETVYSATLPAGEVKQTEFSHTGADTTATYIIHYADGTTKTQVFTSHYHGLPAVYITNDPALATPAVATGTGDGTSPTPAVPAD